MADHTPAPAAELLEYWFGATCAHGYADATHRKRWFMGGADFDNALRDQFGDLVLQALAGELQSWQRSTLGALALILLTDQLPRNLFRGNARAFSGDPIALAAATRLLQRGEDLILTGDLRSFAYMPFEHSESRLHQQLCVGLMHQLLEQAPQAHQSKAESNLDYARQHADIVSRFGRFPHRNDILGRSTTAEEAAWLAADNRRFGQ